MQIYSDSSRESETFALPNVEVWHVPPGDHRTRRLYFETSAMRDVYGESIHGMQSGWYWWACFPGCLPDSEAIGPFATEAEAVADAQEQEIV